jgi:hypothetical protein
LLREENAELSAINQELEETVREQERVIYNLEEFRLNASHDKILGRDLLSEREKDQLGRGKELQSRVLTPRGLGVKSRTDLFFDFAHSKEREPNVNRSQSKIVNTDHPTFKDINAVTLPKKGGGPKSARSATNETI